MNLLASFAGAISSLFGLLSAILLISTSIVGLGLGSKAWNDIYIFFRMHVDDAGKQMGLIGSRKIIGSTKVGFASCVFGLLTRMHVIVVTILSTLSSAILSIVNSLFAFSTVISAIAAPILVIVALSKTSSGFFRLATGFERYNTPPVQPVQVTEPVISRPAGTFGYYNVHHVPDDDIVDTPEVMDREQPYFDSTSSQEEPDIISSSEKNTGYEEYNKEFVDEDVNFEFKKAPVEEKTRKSDNYGDNAVDGDGASREGRMCRYCRGSLPCGAKIV